MVLSDRERFIILEEYIKNLDQSDITHYGNAIFVLRHGFIKNDQGLENIYDEINWFRKKVENALENIDRLIEKFDRKTPEEENWVKRVCDDFEEETKIICEKKFGHRNTKKIGRNDYLTIISQALRKFNLSKKPKFNYDI